MEFIYFAQDNVHDQVLTCTVQSKDQTCHRLIAGLGRVSECIGQLGLLKLLAMCWFVWAGKRASGNAITR